MDALTGRADGRQRREKRKLEVLVEEEAVLARLYTETGEKKHYSTAVVVYRSVEIKKPQQSASNRGSISITSNDKGLQCELKKIFTESAIIPLEKLSIVPKKAVWSIKLEVFVAVNKGGVLSAATEGVFQAVAGLVFPESYISFGYDSLCTKQISASPLFIPAVHTKVFGGAEGGAEGGGEALGVWSDPTDKEEENKEGVLTLCTNDHREFVHLSFTGAVEMDRLLSSIRSTITEGGE
ncbi:exosome complex component RRP45 [Nematocida sp. AWRm77]|nr:exosome complex component RRP45 [Nematocida sp. AWRm77]